MMPAHERAYCGSTALDLLKRPRNPVTRRLGQSCGGAASFFGRSNGGVGRRFSEALYQLYQRIALTSRNAEAAGKTFHWSGVPSNHEKPARPLLTDLGPSFERSLPTFAQSHQAAPSVYCGNIAPGLQALVLSSWHRPSVASPPYHGICG